jgi:hypothetical protein
MEFEWHWWWLVFIPLAWIWQNGVHELSHLWMAWYKKGRKPIGWYPYPHIHNGKFFFARSASGPATKPGSTRMVYIAPFLFGIVLTWIYAAVMVLAWPNLWFLFGLMSLFAFIDSMFFWWTFFLGSPMSDGKMFRAED